MDTARPAPRVRFFGQYLVERGVISAHDLKQAVEIQDRRNLPIGLLAIGNAAVQALL